MPAGMPGPVSTARGCRRGCGPYSMPGAIGGRGAARPWLPALAREGAPAASPLPPEHHQCRHCSQTEQDGAGQLRRGGAATGSGAPIARRVDAIACAIAGILAVRAALVAVAVALVAVAVGLTPFVHR